MHRLPVSSLSLRVMAGEGVAQGLLLRSVSERARDKQSHIIHVRAPSQNANQTKATTFPSQPSSVKSALFSGTLSKKSFT